jgi:transposase
MTRDEVQDVERFRQMKKEIRGSTDYLIIGIDIAKDRHYAFFGDANGQTIARKYYFENDASGFEHLLISIQQYMYRNGFKKNVVGMEPTGVYHKPLAEFLINQGHLVVYVTGSAIKRNRELLDGRWDGNDTKDAANVADLISQGKCQYYDWPNKDLRELRRLISFHAKLKKTIGNDGLPSRNAVSRINVTINTADLLNK